MVHLYSDIIGSSGGIESYLHALSLKLNDEGIPFRVWVCEAEHSPLIDELVAAGIQVFRQPRVLGDRWRMRQRVLLWSMCRTLRSRDWVYCVREPMEEMFLHTVRTVHRHGGRIAASWMLSPELLRMDDRVLCKFRQAVQECDAVISVSRCGVPQFKEIYGYDGHVHVVRYHNLPLFDAVVPLPSGPPWKIGYMGRLSMDHKNLDGLVAAFTDALKVRQDIELHIYGSGPDEDRLKSMVDNLQVREKIFFHGRYDHRRDLSSVMAGCHFFSFPSRIEGGPSFVLLEYLQAGRFCVAAAVGGAPDVYEGRREAGLLVRSGDDAELTRALLDTVGRLERGEIDPEEIRVRYFEEFDMKHAHNEWLHALGVQGKAGLA